MLFSYAKNILTIDKYRDIILMNNDLICLSNIKIYGTNMQIIFIDKYQIVIKGSIFKIELGDFNNDIQNKNE